jgi:hypothetical protein
LRYFNEIANMAQTAYSDWFRKMAASYEPSSQFGDLRQSSEKGVPYSEVEKTIADDEKPKP